MSQQERESDNNRNDSDWRDRLQQWINRARGVLDRR
jgi:hypothetical protein